MDFHVKIKRYVFNLGRMLLYIFDKSMDVIIPIFELLWILIKMCMNCGERTPIMFCWTMSASNSIFKTAEKQKLTKIYARRLMFWNTTDFRVILAWFGKWNLRKLKIGGLNIHKSIKSLWFFIPNKMQNFCSPHNNCLLFMTQLSIIRY